MPRQNTYFQQLSKAVGKEVIHEEKYKEREMTDEEVQEVLDLIKSPASKLIALSAGKYNSGRMFITIKIDNI